MNNRTQSYPRVLIWLTVFGIAMAFLESAVVVYLRTLYYPTADLFPMPPVDFIVAVTEIGRELATIIMLLAIAVLTGKNAIHRFGYFIYSFAIWDIFYYVFLKLLIDWPASLFDTDILFLIPVVWISPVICPVITSVLMVILALFITGSSEQSAHKLMNWKVWSLLMSGSIVVLISFMYESLKMLLTTSDYKGNQIIAQGTRKLIVAPDFIPGKFNWLLFIGGILIISAAIMIVGSKFVVNRRENK